MSHFAARGTGPSHTLVPRRLGSLQAEFSLREGSQNTAGTLTHNCSYGSFSGPRFESRIGPRFPPSEPDRPAPRRRLRQSQHPRHLRPRPPSVRRLATMTRPSPTPLLLDTLPSSTTRAGPRAASPSASAPALPSSRSRPRGSGASRGPPFQPRRVPASPPSHRPGASLRPPPSYAGRPAAPRAARIPHAEPQDLRPSAPHTTAVYPEARPPRGRLRCLNCADAFRADRPSTGRAIVLSFPAFRAGFGLPRRTVRLPSRVRSPPGACRGPCDPRGCPIPTRLRFPPAPEFRRSASRL